MTPLTRRGVARDDGVVPAAAARAAGRGAELRAVGAQPLAVGVEQLGRERAPPTRVVYALTTAMTRSMRVGGMPEPVHAPPAVGLDDVTNG